MESPPDVAARRRGFSRWLRLPRPLSGVIVWVAISVGATTALLELIRGPPASSTSASSALRGGSESAALHDKAGGSEPARETVAPRALVETIERHAPVGEGPPAPTPIEILRVENPSSERAYTLGEHPLDSRTHLTIRRKIQTADSSEVEIVRGDGFCAEGVEVFLDHSARAARVRAWSWQDAGPTMRYWSDVVGAIETTSWDLTGRTVLTIALAGLDDGRVSWVRYRVLLDG